MIWLPPEGAVRGTSGRTTGPWVSGDAVSARVVATEVTVSPDCNRALALEASGSTSVLNTSIWLGWVSEVVWLALVMGRLPPGCGSGPWPGRSGYEVPPRPTGCGPWHGR